MVTDQDQSPSCWCEC